MAAPVIELNCTRGGRCEGCEVEIARKGIAPDEPLMALLDSLCRLRTGGSYPQKAEINNSPEIQQHQSTGISHLV
jgi:hypothetical protein